MRTRRLLKRLSLTGLLLFGCACGIKYFAEGSKNIPTTDTSRLNNYLSLLKLCHSENLHKRSLGVNALANLGHLHDFKLQQICQLSDCSVLAALIIKRVSLKKYLSGRFEKAKTQSSLEEQCVKLLEDLNSLTDDSTLKYYTNLALNKLPNVSTADLESFAGSSIIFPSEHPFDESSSEQHLLLHAKAIEVHSTNPSQCRHMIRYGIFELLKRLWLQSDNFSDKNRLKITVLKILANLSLRPSLADNFRYSGWLAVLEDCLQNPKLEYYLISNKILHNLAGSYQEDAAKFFDNVYLISGGDWEKKQPAVDIIFIHGLRGRLFHTWRQKDWKDKVKIGPLADLPPIPLTPCWPKDWLPNDLNAPVRILAIDYESYLSSWIPRSPDVKIKHKLENRSRDILKKLKYAGVGDRPIIWVAHSMGGLAVKRMLNLIKDEDEKDEWSSFDCVLDRTKGCVFYSTPHFGSPVASSVQGWYRFFALPSVEVSELAENSDYLVKLHRKFKENAKARGFKIINLSESLPTKIQQLKLNVLLVPKYSAFGFKKSDDLAHLIENNAANERFYQLDSNHFEICKPKSKAFLSYRIIVDFINEILSDLRFQ